MIIFDKGMGLWNIVVSSITFFVVWSAIGMIAFSNHAAIIALCAMMAAKISMHRRKPLISAMEATAKILPFWRRKFYVFKSENNSFPWTDIYGIAIMKRSFRKWKLHYAAIVIANCQLS